MNKLNSQKQIEFSDAIDFANWINKSGFNSCSFGKWYYFLWGTGSPFVTTEYLYDKFKRGLELKATDKLEWIPTVSKMETV